MMKALKWVGIVSGVLVAFVIIALAGIHIYDPESRESWVKPGIAQEEIPAGIEASVVFENVTVIPMDNERILDGQTVLINDGRIAELGTGGEIDIPADAQVVDGAGKFLIPGSGDMHVHWRGAENDMLVYLANGVTLIRTMGGETPAILEYRDEINAGTRVGPSILAWWPSIETDVFGGGDPEWIREFQTRGGETYVHTPAEAEQLVAEAAALGVDGIKSHNVVPTGIFLALMESAAEHDLPFDGHAPADHANCRPDKPECVCARRDCWNAFRNMGAPALAHVEELIKVVDLVDVNSRQASDESIRQIAQDAADDGLWVTTTLNLMRSIADQAADLEGTLATMPEVKYVHPRVFDTGKWGPGENYYVETGSRPWWPEYVAAQEKMVQALNEQGGLIMSGTDATTPVMVPGFSLHDELETMVDVGLPPMTS